METDIKVGLILLDDHCQAMRKKNASIRAVQQYASEEGREGWERFKEANTSAHKWIRMEVSIRCAVYGQADKIISNEQLYADLSN